MTTASTSGKTADGDDNSYRSYCSPATINGQRVMIAAYDRKNPIIMVFDRYGHIFLWLNDKPTKEQIGEVLVGIADTDVWTTEDPFLDKQPLLEDFDAIEEEDELRGFVPQNELLEVNVTKIRQFLENLGYYEMED